MLNFTDFCISDIEEDLTVAPITDDFYDYYEEDPTVASIAALSPLALLKHPSIICRSRAPKNSSGLTFQVLRKGVILANPF